MPPSVWRSDIRRTRRIQPPDQLSGCAWRQAQTTADVRNLALLQPSIQPVGNKGRRITSRAEGSAESDHFLVVGQILLSGCLRIRLRIQPELQIVHQHGALIRVKSKIPLFFNDVCTDGTDDAFDIRHIVNMGA